jgi:hypothetical protein
MSIFEEFETIEEAQSYFKDNGADYCECDSDSYMDEYKDIIKIGDDYFDVDVNFKINWSEYGDHSSYVCDGVNSVKITKADKSTIEKVNERILNENIKMFLLSKPNSEHETVKEYLKELLYLLIDEEEYFNSKRLFGQSGWILDLVHPLVRLGIIKGNYDPEDDCIDDYSEKEAKVFILKAINHIFKE